MANTRKDRFEKNAAKAIRAMQKSLFEDGLTELQAMSVLKMIHTNLGIVLHKFTDEAPTSQRQEDSQ